MLNMTGLLGGGFTRPPEPMNLKRRAFMTVCRSQSLTGATPLDPLSPKVAPS